MEVIDTFAWIEYFSGTDRGAKAKPYIEKGDSITPSVVVAELVDKCTREGTDPAERLKFVRSKTSIAQLDYELAEAAGMMRAERASKVKGWGMIDSCILATARARGLKVVTGDSHFATFPDAIMI